MKILDIRPAPPGVGRTIANFDVQLTPDCRFYGLRLVEAEGGRHLTYAPNSHGVRVATFTRELADTISRAASAAWSEYSAQHQS
ncbi:MAG: hypothetical protein E5Y10_32590 [Mesorhizobium sp.]|uniref:hypothetical protein n=1 Tax=Mesorhizobium sp. TaxID=1871066 RepID=UPI0012056BB0|nr:hypothetical protein [Mesorhizobium sp.]TIN33351.1 MAG: hypothetical protein E5Y13_33050 [Mesorhizobium sp.]TJU83976.1 MAG: hypothetical protein E5Y10_32590 [Mesorhizobium sp.]